MGNTVREFADEDATIIVGSVFDPDLEDQLRVGCSNWTSLTPSSQALAVIVDNQPPRKVGGDIDYGQLDRPTVNRNRRAATMHGGSEATATQFDAQLESETDYLDVPTFLRKQAN